MDVNDYRRQVEAELSAAPAAPRRIIPRSPRPEVSGFVAREQPMVLSSRAAPDPAPDPDQEIPRLLQRLQRSRLSAPTFLDILRKLAAATFLGERFAPYRAEYLATMRSLSRRADVPVDVRRAALAALAAEQDPDAQDQIKHGLLHPDQAVMAAPAALALLSHDDHSAAAKVARQVFEGSSDIPTREAALRVLSTDPGAEGLLASVTADKSEARDVRAMGAAALQSLNPDRFSAVARSIILDDDDYDDIRAASVGAFANHPDRHASGSDGELLSKIDALAADASKPDLSAAARRLVANTGAIAGDGRPQAPGDGPDNLREGAPGSRAEEVDVDLEEDERDPDHDQRKPGS